MTPERPLLTRLSPAPRKIAVVRASRLGDFICATPALRALRAALPSAEIVMITLPLLRDLVARLPYIDRFVAFPGFPGIAQQFFNPHEALAFFQHMQTERFDLALQLQGSGVYANPFTLLLGASATAGFVRAEDDASALATSLVWPARGHETERLLALMEHVGVGRLGNDLAFPLWQDDRDKAAQILARLPPPYIGVHAGSHDPYRRWPLERFAAVARTLLRRYGGTVLVLGGIHESEQTLGLCAAIGPGAYNLAGRTSLGTLGAVIERLALLISNDSGPAHIGYALSTPTVGIYRTGGAERYGPASAGPFAALEPHLVDAADPASGLVSIPQVLAAADRLLAQAHEEQMTWMPEEPSKESAE
ncbi:MAG: glycosyltransferase family 9 protein [Sulfurifustaceae bacterium]